MTDDGITTAAISARANESGRILPVRVCDGAATTASANRVGRITVPAAASDRAAQSEAYVSVPVSHFFSRGWAGKGPLSRHCISEDGAVAARRIEDHANHGGDRTRCQHV